jgi:hypothetical protein
MSEKTAIERHLDAIERRVPKYYNLSAETEAKNREEIRDLDEAAAAAAAAALADTGRSL